MDRLLPLVPGQTPNASLVVPVLDVESGRADAPAGLAQHFLAEAEGFLLVPEDGVYELGLACDDGGELWLDGELVIGHDGLHPLTARRVGLELAKGAHALRVRWFQNEGGYGLRLEWRPDGAEDPVLVPAEALACVAGEVRVTSPGTKRVVRGGGRDAPGDGLPLAGVHPSFTLEDLRPEGFEPKVGGLAWLPDGRLAVATWDAVGAVWILDGLLGGDAPVRDHVRATRFAAGLAEPLGLCAIGSRLFVLQKQELTELEDLDGDGVCDEYRAVCSGWPVSANFHEFAFGLVYRDGFFYANLAIAIDPGGRSTKEQVEDRGSVLKIALADGSWEAIAHGLRAPNGIGVGAGGAIFLTDNQGDWLPVSKLLRLVPGAFYGNRSVLSDDAIARLAYVPPVLWLPQDEIGNSPSQPSRFPPGNGPYSGQMLHGDVTHGGLKRDFVEEVDGAWQGCVFRFTQGLEAGVNRVAWGPDGALYAGGIGSTGNWGQTGKRRFGLQRLTYNGRPAFEMLAVRARTNGLEVELTEPLAEGSGWDPESWQVTQWRYEATPSYGGPKLDERELPVLSASVAPDARHVFLELPGLAPDHVVHLRIVDPFVSAAGRPLWSTEAWYTLNRIPRDLPGGVLARPPEPPPNVLSQAERAAGFEPLFDGRTLAGWHGYGAAEGSVPDGWRVEDGTIARVGPGGDLVTDGQFGDFELRLQWRIAPGGNSGIFFHVQDGQDAVWRTGPEMQVLDNAHHADGHSPLTSAGADYALYAPVRDVTRPVGLFNEARIRVEKGRVTHWLNGVELLSYELGSPEWMARVAGSKFASMPGYGRAQRGRIALQDHGDPVWYRNIRIKRLD
jgi:cytochrome c